MSSVPNTTTSVSSHPQTFSVAVIGGGIGGLALAIGLLNYPHIDVHVYESAPSFVEIGAGVALGPNAQRALEHIDPSAKKAFDKHATPNMWASHANVFADYVVGTKGEHENQLIHSQMNATGMQSVHRAHFLDELVKLVPAKRVHFNKGLTTIEDEPEKQVVMHFKDGTTARADAVIGADGIHSHVREYLLGKEAAAPSFPGSVAYRGLVPMDAAVEKLGAEFAQNCVILCGNGKATMSYPIDHGNILNVAIMDHEHKEWEHEKWIVPAKREELENLLEGFGESAHRLIDLLNIPDLAAWALWEVPSAPFFNKSRVAMMGDAAHATTPFEGQGATLQKLRQPRSVMMTVENTESSDSNHGNAIIKSEPDFGTNLDWDQWKPFWLTRGYVAGSGGGRSDPREFLSVTTWKWSSEAIRDFFSHCFREKQNNEVA